MLFTHSLDDDKFALSFVIPIPTIPGLSDDEKLENLANSLSDLELEGIEVVAHACYFQVPSNIHHNGIGAIPRQVDSKRIHGCIL